MTTPQVTELPRRLEATSPDTFLAGGEPARRAPLAPVITLRPRDPRRTPPPPRRPQPTNGPGGNAA